MDRINLLPGVTTPHPTTKHAQSTDPMDIPIDTSWISHNKQWWNQPDVPTFQEGKANNKPPCSGPPPLLCRMSKWTLICTALSAKSCISETQSRSVASLLQAAGVIRIPSLLFLRGITEFHPVPPTSNDSCGCSRQTAESQNTSTSAESLCSSPDCSNNSQHPHPWIEVLPEHIYTKWEHHPTPNPALSSASIPPSGQNQKHYCTLGWLHYSHVEALQHYSSSLESHRVTLEATTQYCFLQQPHILFKGIAFQHRAFPFLMQNPFLHLTACTCTTMHLTLSSFLLKTWSGQQIRAKPGIPQ